MSLPTRGAWIEMGYLRATAKNKEGRSLRGERGLKYCRYLTETEPRRSLPTRGAWIEIAPGNSGR